MDLGKALTQFIYPTFCMHCQSELENSNGVLCNACFNQIEWLVERCLFCKIPLEKNKTCDECQLNPLNLKYHTSFFNSQGPILSIYQHFIETRLAKNIAALIVIGIDKYNLPEPQGIVPLLHSREKSFFIKKQLPFLLAKSMGEFFECPMFLPSKNIEGKNIFLVTEYLESSHYLRKKKEELEEFFPSKINSIAFIDGR